MQEKTTKVKRYVCDNCGAIHSDRYEIFPDANDGEYCTKCGLELRIADISIYNRDDRIEAYTTTKLVNPHLVKATELDLEIDTEEYLSRVLRAKKLYIDLMNKIDKEYLKGRVRDFNVGNFVKEYFGL